MTAAQLLDISPDDYHKRPGLSASIATTLIGKSPLHAWTEHPAYGGKSKTPTREMDRGAVVHALTLGAGKRFAVLEHDDYRTSKAKDERDKARADGMVPILRDKFIEAGTIAVEVKRQLTERGIELNGRSEAALEWHEDSASGPVLCRGMMDHLLVERGIILDLKIVESAAPLSVERSAENYGYAIQCAAYTSAVTKLRPELAGRVEFLLVFAEPEAPYAINICAPDGAFRELGERRWRRAVETWGVCVKANVWPGYGSGVNLITAPVWALQREEWEVA